MQDRHTLLPQPLSTGPQQPGRRHILGRLATSGWADVWLLGPYVVVCGAVLIAHRRHLDVLRLGEDEAHALGVDVRKVRWIVLVAASLLTAGTRPLAFINPASTSVSSWAASPAR